MSQLLQSHIDLLLTITRSSLNKVDGVIKHFSNNVIKLFCEVVLNILKGITPITSREKTILFVLKPNLRTLIAKGVSLKTKRGILEHNIKLVKLLAKIVIRYFTIEDK
jgi:hypothetical protein